MTARQINYCFNRGSGGGLSVRIGHVEMTAEEFRAIGAEFEKFAQTDLVALGNNIMPGAPKLRFLMIGTNDIKGNPWG